MQKHGSCVNSFIIFFIEMHVNICFLPLYSTNFHQSNTLYNAYLIITDGCIGTEQLPNAVGPTTTWTHIDLTVGPSNSRLLSTCTSECKSHLVRQISPNSLLIFGIRNEMGVFRWEQIRFSIGLLRSHFFSRFFCIQTYHTVRR